MRVLVTGANGFVGRHVLSELAAAGHVPLAVDIEPPANPAVEFRQGDVRDSDGFRRIVRELKPDGCIHLAGIAFVPTGWSDPELVFSVNLLGTLHVLEAFRDVAPMARIVVVTSSQVYGRKAVTGGRLTENAPLVPADPYSVSKMSADLTALFYARHHGLQIVVARPDNHIGPGQSPRFVASAFADQVAAIASGKAKPVLRVGNLDSERDFTDVRDIARGYRLLLERGRAGEAYNLASGKPVTIRHLLEELCRLAGVRPEIQVDPERFRPTDNPPVLDTGKIRAQAGWEPQIPLETTLKDLLDDSQRRQSS